MADLSITISNSLNVFGLGPPSLWGEDWNEFNWGYGSATIPHDATHVYSTDLTPDTSMAFEVSHLVEETLTPTDDYSKEASISYNNDLVPEFEMTDERLGDGSGYTYVFPSDATNLEDRDVPSYTSQAAGSQTYTSAAVGSTTWS
jgi:hypothetical protein